ncbi:MAG: hypothetical protein IKC89_07210 [Lentisphaeria bacterium]|nr:hypothetical protein [Lentisphaeria bacterium]
MTSRHRSLQRIVPLLIFIAGSVVISGKLLPELPVFITDNGNKYIVMRNVAEHGTLAIQHPEPALFPRGGFHFQSLADSAVYSFHSWVLPVVSVPFYLIAGESGALLPVWLAGAGVILLLMQGNKRERFALWGVLLTTPFWLYSTMLWEMVPSMFAALAGFIMLKRRNMLAAGVIFGLGIWLREELYILSFITGVLLLCRRQWRDALKFAAGTLAATVLLWLINLYIYGHILGLHGATYALNNREGVFSLAAEINGLIFNFYQHLLRFETLAAVRTSFVLSIIGAAALVVPGFFSNIKLKLAGLTIFTVIELIFTGALFHPRHADSQLFLCGVTMSLFFTLPLAAGYFINLRTLLADRDRYLRFMAQAVLIYIVFVPLMLTRFDIGLTFGARHYMCIMPMMMILSFRSFAQMQCPVRVKQILLITLCAAGITLQYWGFQTLYISSHHSAALEKHLAALPEKTVVSDVFFLPEQTPRLFFTKQCLEVVSNEQLSSAIAYLHHRQINEFILILGRNQFRRMDNTVLKQLLERYPVCAPPQEISAAPGMPLFIVRCRKAAPSAAQ